MLPPRPPHFCVIGARWLTELYGAQLLIYRHQCGIQKHPPMDLKTLRPRQNIRHFPDDIFKCIFMNENLWIAIDISLKFVPKALINNILALVEIMAWRRPGDKPLSETMMVRLLTDICVTRSEWVNGTLTVIWCRVTHEIYIYSK